MADSPTQTQEIWKPIPGFSAYQVSSRGRVRRLTPQGPRLLTPWDKRGDSARVNLSQNNQRKAFQIRQLVAQAFLPNPGHYANVINQNGDIWDNRTENLTWVSKCGIWAKSLPGEKWKAIPGFEDYYKVSSRGRIRRLQGTYAGYIMRTNGSSNGYAVAMLSRGGQKSRFTVHRLVALAFLPNPDNYPVVSHLNGIRDDNRVENLVWRHRSKWDQFDDLDLEGQPITEA